MVSSQCDSSEKLITDSIHGDIHLKKREVQVIDTPSFQRLRQLNQLAMAQLVYPTATHTRFAHSIGALGTMIRILGYCPNLKIIHLLPRPFLAYILSGGRPANMKSD